MIRTDGDRELLDDPNLSIIKNHQAKYGGLGIGVEEWDVEKDSRVLESSWVARYNHEANILCNIIKDNNISKVLELGSGPGRLADTIQKGLDSEIIYDLVDKPNAKLQNDKFNYKCNKFFVKDLNNGFDTSGLEDEYDLIIANDFLEHIANVTDCLVNCYNKGSDNSKLFISVPNWRMGHSFQYRGLFDYDNWVYTMEVHGWKVEGVYNSNLACKYADKLSSESSMPDQLIQSWNWYFLASKKI